MVQDMNDNALKFEKEMDEIDVDERLPRDTQILPLNARDMDKGKNSCLLYPAKKWNYFSEKHA